MNRRTLILTTALLAAGCSGSSPDTVPDAGCARRCGSACCDPGEVCSAGRCVARCEPQCDGRECGDDGCGGSCGECRSYDRCDEAAGTCIRCVASCAGKVCGSNGCGGSCGGCSQGQVCGTDGQCRQCTPKTCAELGKNCGSVPDGCGGTLQCGTCSGLESCGGAGAPNVCGCAPTTCRAQGKDCGTIPDGCGGTLSCGTCASGEYCKSGVCSSGPCVNETDLEFCTRLGAQCGTVTEFDNCGKSRTVNCGVCRAPQSCGVERANVCADDCRLGAACPAQTFCDEASGACRKGCNSTADCGANQTCDVAAHTCVCNGGHHLCGSTCAADTDANACGSTCLKCPGAANGTPTCVYGACGVSCNTGYLWCGNACTACSDPHGTPSCSANACSIRCNSGYHLCGGKCAADNDVNACGASCQKCPGTTNGAPVCSGGACGFKCDPGYVLCGGKCIACGDANGTGSCVNNACSISCKSGYNLCGGKCVADTNVTACGSTCQVCTAPSGGNLAPACSAGRCTVQCKSGMTVCKGQCSSAATCSWTAHTSATPTYYLGIAVDANGAVHVATTAQYKLNYFKVDGPGVPAPENVGTGTPCFEGDPYYASDTQPFVFPDGSGKATLACLRSNMVDGWSWSGSAWWENDVSSSTSLYDRPQFMSKHGNRLGFYKYLASYYGDHYLVVDELSGQTWNNIISERPSGAPGLVNVLGGAAGAAKVAWLRPGSTSDLLVATQGGSTSQTLPHVAKVYALDSAGRVVGVSDTLRYYAYEGSAWQSEPIASDTATHLDLVVDALGIPHVAWINNSGGVFLASRIGGTWHVESVTTGAYSLDLDVGPTGKVAIGIVGNGFSIFD